MNNELDTGTQLLRIYSVLVLWIPGFLGLGSENYPYIIRKQTGFLKFEFFRFFKGLHRRCAMSTHPNVLTLKNCNLMA